MATGYTSEIGKGQTARDFILRCTRAMGACVMQRDANISELPPKAVEPSDYHQKRIDELLKSHTELAAMTQNDKGEAAKGEFEKEVLANRRHQMEDQELKSKYQDMLIKVKAWQPPTPDHEGLLEFMIKQIESSVEFDCIEHKREIIELNGQQWYSKKVDKVLRNIGYHVLENHAEIERAKERTEWLQALWDSLPEEE